tara:strand:+ start:494 stop:688 length:195 start_codon:yes stop_codon:yes gene_type:complete
MKCWTCKTELIWGGDHDTDDSEEYCIETNLSCPKCNALVLFYTPRDQDEQGIETKTNVGQSQKV